MRHDLNSRTCLCAKQYEDGEEVYLWMNKVGPFPNPQETYPYYSLPFCHPDKLIHSDTGRSFPCSIEVITSISLSLIRIVLLQRVLAKRLSDTI